MEVGKITRIVDRGFGFITAGDGNEVFFHRSECLTLAFDSLTEGQEVAFDREANAKGPRARNIRPNGQRLNANVTQRAPASITRRANRNWSSNVLPCRSFG